MEELQPPTTLSYYRIVSKAGYRQIEEIIVRDRPMLPLFHEQAYRFARPEVEGMSLSYDSLALDFSNLSIRS